MAGGPVPGSVPAAARLSHLGCNLHLLKQHSSTGFSCTCLKPSDTIDSSHGELALSHPTTHNVLLNHHQARKDLIHLCTTGTDDTAHNLFRCPARAGCQNCKIGNRLCIVSQRSLEEQQEIEALLQFIPKTLVSSLNRLIN